MTHRFPLIFCFLTACAADTHEDPSPLDDGGPADAEPADGAPVDAAPVDATIPEPDAVPGPECVAPSNGACPPDVRQVVRGGRFDPEADCWQRDIIISCLYDVGQSPGTACFRRTDDGTYYGVGSITCLPFPAEECHGDLIPRADAPDCPVE
jgi:hypothetical protein